MPEEDDAKQVVTREEADEMISHGHGQYQWYADEAAKAERKLAQVTWAGMGAGLAASALAALPGSLLSDQWNQLTRWIVAVLTLLVTLFSGTLASRYRRLAVARERGRVATALANNTTRVRLQYHAMTRQERGDLLGAFERRLLDIEGQDGIIDPKVAAESHGADPERG